ncbi:hypothetical protein [Glycomyces buryatensis]|uniref:ATP/GTP-binding protein n=1 Tax=Glycomyces buryatensis TaxID=2570927 RepID=A0A4S8QFQ3_9ACTN|nr:hypothetical protein [Glycomyces buryatensis]THV41972.1 hypothetical protein FAB82_08555 [Glycomyces buryatensis]
MPRKNRRERPAEPPTRSAQDSNLVDGPDGRYQTRAIPGAGAAKTYRCPGCDLEIPPGTPHVVAWADEGDGDDRRHWHKGCWNARDRRRPGQWR